jgi:hypothetical protein
MLSKIYVISNTNSIQTIESMYKHFSFRSPLQFVPAVETFSESKKYEFYEKFKLQRHPDPLPYNGLYYESPESEFEYATNHWIIWNLIQEDICRGSLKIQEDSYFLIIDNDISFNYSISNAIVYYESILSDIRKNDLLQSWDIIYLSYDCDFSRKILAEKTVLVTPRIGIPTHRIHINGAYLLSVRGLKKLAEIDFRNQIQPLNRYFNYLQTDSINTKIHDLMYIYYSTTPIFNRNLQQ